MGEEGGRTYTFHKREEVVEVLVVREAGWSGGTPR